MLALLLAACTDPPATEAGRTVASPAASIASPAGDTRPSFLVIAPDTLRADRVHATRDGAPVMPNLQRLATRGAVFTRAYSQSGWTLPALASFLSGRYPLVPRKVDGRGFGFLRGDVPTLPERLGAAGYATAVFWGEGISVASPEFSRGFTHVDREAAPDRSADVLAWIGETDGPFFALVHNIDLQFPIAPVPGDALLADVHPAADRGMEPVYAALAATAGPARADASIRAAYDAAVTHYDATIGRLVDGLAAAGRDDDTVVVVLSNHGLELGEHGNYWHGVIYDTNLHIPLVIADPAATPRTVDTLVQTIDVAPTLLRRAGLSPGPELAGQSLLPLLGLADGAYTERPVFAFNTASLLAARSPAYKVARILEPTGAVKIQAFDLAADPAERAELGGPLPPAAEALRRDLDAWWDERQRETAAAGPTTGGEPLKQALREHGYWGLVTGEAAGTGGKPPPDGSPADEAAADEAAADEATAAEARADKATADKAAADRPAPPPPSPPPAHPPNATGGRGRPGPVPPPPPGG